MTYSEVVEWLFQQIPNYQHQGGTAYKPGLERITELLEKVGNPHRSIKTIHVAGTNGKGSVSHILAAVFQAHGYKTGLFTSPHITDFRERIKLDGKWIDPDFVVHFVEENRVHIQNINPSFFEITTAMAFLAFAQHKCDIAIIETGLGGRLDSTNVITPQVSVITNIGLDHTAFLGNSLPEIALEKAGIIKPNVPVVMGDVLEELKPIFQQVAEQRNSALFFSNDELKVFRQTDLLGSFQQRNIQTAMLALHVLKSSWNLDDEVIKTALKNVVIRTNFRGRMQQIGQSPQIIVDAAHNEDGINTLINELALIDFENLKVIYGASNDKNWPSIIKKFPKSTHFYFAQFDSQRSVTKAEFSVEANRIGLIFNAYSNVVEAYQECKQQASSKDLILICGSFYLIEKII